MPYNVYSTTRMLMAVKKLYPVFTWFKNRYFPTQDADVFPTSKVLIETAKGGKKMAPFVLPIVGGMVMEREGYEAREYEPPCINPKKKLTIDDLNVKGFGEDLYSEKTPEQRQEEVLGEDLREMYDSIDRRIEWMCVQLLLNGQITMNHVADESSGKTIQKVLRFYNSEYGFQNLYTPSKKWNEEGNDKYADLDAMVHILNQANCRAADLILSGDLVKDFIEDEKIQNLFSIRRMELGTIAPIETPEGVGYLGTINVRGKNLNIFAVDAVIEDKPLLAEGTVILTAPGMGRTLYGSVTQLEQSDNAFHTYRAQVVPKYIADPKKNIREVMLTSRPVPVPNDTEAWVVAKVK